jgi:hypothetical protein
VRHLPQYSMRWKLPHDANDTNFLFDSPTIYCPKLKH